MEYLKIAFRSILRHKSKMIAICFLVFFGTILIILGQSFVDAASYWSKKAIIDNFTGDLIIYSQKSKDKPSPFSFISPLQNIANIEKILKVYSKNNIPVFIIEPVCNLIDMPPFSGENDEQLKEQIIQFMEAIFEKRTNEITNIFDQLETSKFATNNANFLFLKAIKVKQENSSNYINYFIKAKDMDIIPFRVKSMLVQELNKFCLSVQGKYTNLYYIPLFDKLTNEFGEKILGNDIFIDHVHFNHKGHIIVSRFLAESITEHFLPQKTLFDIHNISTNQSRVDELIYYLPAYEIQAFLRLAYLFMDTPYKEMLIQYKTDFSPLSNNELIKNKHFQKVFTREKQIIALSTPEYVDFIVDFYLNENDINRAYRYLLSFNKMYPAAIGGNINLGIFLASRTTNNLLAINYFTKAYLLSGKSRDVFDIFSMYFPKDAGAIK